MASIINLETCYECGASVTQPHSSSCKTELCKNCGLSHKRENEENFFPCSNYIPLSTIWNGSILSKIDSMIPSVSWSLLFQIRKAVNTELEKFRQEKLIGKGIEASIIIAASPSIQKLIELFPSSLAEFFGVSIVEFLYQESISSIIIQVISLKNNHKKCDRCFRYGFETNIHDYWPTYHLCKRCVETLLEIKWPPFIMNDETGECYVCKNEQEWHKLKAKL
jgi:hypothetical protein